MHARLGAIAYDVGKHWRFITEETSKNKTRRYVRRYL